MLLKTFKKTLIKQLEENAASIYDHETEQTPKVRGRPPSVTAVVERLSHKNTLLFMRLIETALCLTMYIYVRLIKLYVYNVHICVSY